jgi:hypothetical protein
VTEDNVIPIYVRGATSIQDPRTKNSSSSSELDPSSSLEAGASTDVPNRPQGRRIDATTQNPQANVANNPFGGVTLPSSYGFFPSLFGLQFQSFTRPSANTNRQLNAEDASQQLYLSRYLYVLAAFVFACLILI